jgi:GT2 family glycosyltransferase
VSHELKAQIITFTVVYRNEEKNLGDLLNSIENSATRETKDKVYFLFINNNSTDNSEKIIGNWLLKTQFSGKNINRLENNMGAARQQSLEVSQTPWIAFVDADSILDKAWFEKVFEITNDADEQVCAVGGCSTYIESKNWHKFATSLSDYFPMGKVSGLTTQVLHVPTNNYLLNRQKANKALGFDSFFKLVGEDLDINVRLNKVGNIYYNPNFIVQHKLPSSELGWYTKMALYGRAQSSVFLKYHGSIPLEKAIPLLLLILSLGLIVFYPQRTMIILPVILVIPRTRFYLLSFLFYGLGEIVGFCKTLVRLPRHKKAQKSLTQPIMTSEN